MEVVLSYILTHWKHDSRINHLGFNFMFVFLCPLSVKKADEDINIENTLLMFQIELQKDQNVIIANAVINVVASIYDMITQSTFWLLDSIYDVLCYYCCTQVPLVSQDRDS